MKYTAERLTESTLSFVTETEKACFSAPWTKQQTEFEMNNGSSRFFVARDADGSAVAYGSFRFAADTAYINNIAADLSKRRAGAGRFICRVLEGEAVKLGLVYITLEVRPSNLAAVRLYESEGYEKAGLRRDFYSHPTEDGLIMTKRLSSD